MPIDPSKFPSRRRRQEEPEPTGVRSRFDTDEEAGGERATLERLLGVLVRGEEFLPAVTGGRISQEAIEGLPGPLRFATDVLASPVGLATAAAIPVTGGASLGLTGAAGVAARAGTRIGAELAVAGAADIAARQAAEHLPIEDLPAPVAIGATIGAGLLGAVGVGTAINKLTSRTARAALIDQAAEATVSRAVLGNDYVPGLQPLRQVMDGVQDSNVAKIPVARHALDVVDPSKAATSEIGKAHFAFLRQDSVAKHAADEAIAAALPDGMKSLDISPQGLVRGVPKAKNIHANDFMADDEVLAAIKRGVRDKYDLTPAQRADFENYHKVIDDVRRIFDHYGIERTVDDLAGKLYVPRKVRGVKGVKFERPSDEALSRRYELATEAAEAGVDYSHPLDALRLHTQAALRGAAEKQLADEISDMGTNIGRVVFQNKDVAKKYRLWQVAHGQVKEMRLAVEREAARVQGMIPLTATKFEGERNLEALRAALREQMATRDALSKDFRAAFKVAKKDIADGKTAVPARLFKGFEESDEDIPVFLWKQKFVPKTADLSKLDEWFDRTTNTPIRLRPNRATQTLDQINNFMRLSSATFDFAMPFVQGLPLLARNPVLWARMAKAHYKALFNADTFGTYVRQNQQAVDEMVTLGRVIPGDIEFFEAARTGGAASRIIRDRLGGRAFQRAYDTGLMVARVELWKSLRPAWRGTPEELGKYIRNMTGGMETATMGIPPGRRAVESMMFFSPKLLRSTAALVGDATRPWTPQGEQAAMTLLRLAGAAGGTMVLANIGAGLAAGETDAQIDERLAQVLNPMSGRKFLGMRVGDEWFGIGGQVRAITQLVGTSVMDPASLTKPDQLGNPLLRFAGSRLAPAATIVLGGAELATGEEHNFLPYEILDSPVDFPLMVGRNMLPFASQSVLEGFGNPVRPSLEDLKNDPSLAREFAPQFFFDILGSRASEGTPTDALNNLAHAKFGRNWNDLTGLEQQQLEQQEESIAGLIKSRAEFGGKDQRSFREIDTVLKEEARDNQRALMAALTSGVLDRKTFREELNNVQAIRVAKQEATREALGIDFGPSDSAKSRALTAYFQTFEQAQISEGVVDWVLWEQLQAELDVRLKDGEFGEAAEARRFIEERRRFENAPEVQWYFDNQNIISGAGYWDVRSEEFNKLRTFVNATLGFEVRNVSELDRLHQNAVLAGETVQAGVINRLLQRIDRTTSRLRLQLRQRNPELDRALLENGWVEVPARGRRR